MTQTEPEARPSTRVPKKKNATTAPPSGHEGVGTATTKGLRMTRIFTTPGVHPYDEVAWSPRDIVMTNWRDGSVNFAQHGVVFPEFWAENAATIVTSKYFRGGFRYPTAGKLTEAGH